MTGWGGKGRWRGGGMTLDGVGREDDRGVGGSPDGVEMEDGGEGGDTG